MARRVVFVGFMVAVICSIVIPPLLFSHGLIEFESRPGRTVFTILLPFDHNGLGEHA